MSDGEQESGVEAHVLARAYRAAWRARYAAEPVGSHWLTRLDLVIRFGEWASGQPAIPQQGGLPAAASVATICEVVGGREDEHDDE